MAESPRQCLFLSLPLEIRNLIYSQLLSTKHTRVDTVRHTKISVKPHEGHRYRLVHAYHFQIAILRCNRQISEEATAIFRENLYVSVSLNETSAGGRHSSLDMLRRTLWERGLPVLAHYENARSFKNFAMEIHLGSSRTTDSTEMWWNSPKPQQWESRPKIMVVVDDLLEVCKILIYEVLKAVPINALTDEPGSLETSMLLVDVLPMTDRHGSSSEQFRPAVRKLLEPLCFLHNLGIVIIEGSAPKRYIDEVKKRIQRRAPNLQELVDSMSLLKEQGDMNLLSNDPNTAALQYDLALDQCLGGYYRDTSVRNETVVQGHLRGVHANVALDLLIWRLHSGLAAANLHLRKYATAHFWTNVVLLDHTCTDWSISHLWYCRAMASAGKRHHKYAYEEMQQAHVRQPDCVVIMTALADLKARLGDE